MQRARIDHAHAVLRSVRGHVRVTNEEIIARAVGDELADQAEIVSMRYADALAVQFEMQRGMIVFDAQMPGIVGQAVVVEVGVPPHGCCRVSRQRVQHRRAADIATVNEKLGAARQEKFDRGAGGVGMAVGVGENSQDHRNHRILDRRGTVTVHAPVASGRAGGYSVAA